MVCVEKTSDDRQASRLAIRLDEVSEPRSPDLCVLYMHGFASSQSGTKASFFRRRCLGSGIPFCSFDFQGHGDSAGTMKDLTLSRNVDDVGCAHAFLRQRGYRRVVLFGSSMGGASALWYAAQQPAGVAATVSISPALEMEKSLLARIGPEAAERWRRDGEFELQHPLGPVVLNWQMIEDLGSYERQRLQASYAVPALIFQGKHDDSVDWRAVLGFAAGCAYEGIELHLMADGDHRLSERLDHLWRMTLSFLEERVLA